VDARKKEVYAQRFHWGPQGPVAVGGAQVASPKQILRQLAGPVALVGDGVPLYRELIAEVLGADALLPAMPAHQARASQAAWLAWRAYKNGLSIKAAELLPVYIRPSDAELNLPKTIAG
jgi:tRNA threonylcarbamoyladenosine biosynthesis protein TsaB